MNAGHARTHARTHARFGCLDTFRWYLFTDVCFNQPKTFAERLALASRMLPQKLLDTMPVAIDSIDNIAEGLFAAWPERL